MDPKDVVKNKKEFMHFDTEESIRNIFKVTKLLFLIISL